MTRLLRHWQLWLSAALLAAGVVAYQANTNTRRNMQLDNRRHAMSEGPANSEIRLEMTCGACPEQYDAFIGTEQVGYLRLRHGYFRVDFPDCGGETIYETDTIGDGVFAESERDDQLRQAKDAIMTKLAQLGRTP